MNPGRDLQAFEPGANRPDHTPLASYRFKRSRWRFHIGSLELGLERHSERLTARSLNGAGTPGWGARLLLALGAGASLLLVLALTGWLWTVRSDAREQASRATLSANIIDRSANQASGGDAGPSASVQSAAAPARAMPSVKPEHKPESRPAHRQPATAVSSAKAVRPKASAQVAAGLGTAAPTLAVDDAALHHDGGFTSVAAIDTPPASAPPPPANVRSGDYLAIPAVAGALRRALASGEAQNWRAGAYYGVVVVGDPQANDGKSCRAGTVLLRDGSGESHTQSFKRCQAKSG